MITSLIVLKNDRIISNFSFYNFNIFYICKFILNVRWIYFLIFCFILCSSAIIIRILKFSHLVLYISYWIPLGIFFQLKFVVGVAFLLTNLFVEIRWRWDTTNSLQHSCWFYSADDEVFSPKLFFLSWLKMKLGRN